MNSAILPALREISSVIIKFKNMFTTGVNTTGQFLRSSERISSIPEALFALCDRRILTKRILDMKLLTRQIALANL